MAPKVAPKAAPAKAAIPAAKAAPPSKGAPAPAKGAPAKGAPAAKGTPVADKKKPEQSIPPPNDDEPVVNYNPESSGSGNSELADLLASLKGGAAPIKFDFGPAIEEPTVKATSPETIAYIDNLKAKVSLLERQLNDIQSSKKPSPALSSSNPFERIPELEKQLLEMMDTIEMLTLDKEQLMLDCNHLSDNYASLQVELDSAKNALRKSKSETGEINFEDLSNLLEVENDKLREALRRLQEISKKDKESIEQMSPTMQNLEEEIRDLRAFKIQAQENIEILRGKMDSIADFESMIEKLTDENQNLKAKITAYQQEISDMEYAQDISEELDAQHIAIIESDKYTIESLNRKITDMEKKFTEKEYAVIEQKKKIDAMKEASKELKDKLEHIEQLRQYETMESSSLQAKLQEAAVLRTNQELLIKESSSLYNQLNHATSAKFKFQSIVSRLSSLFGENPHYLQEEKVLNVEVAFILNLISGFHAVRMITSHLNSYFSHKFVDSADVQLAVLGKLQLLLLQAQSFSVQSTVFAFKERFVVADSTKGKLDAKLSLFAEKGVVVIDKFRDLFDRVVNLSNILEKFNSSSKRQNNRKDGVSNILYEEEMSQENSLLLSRKDELLRIIAGFEAFTDELATILRSTSGMKVGSDKLLTSSLDMFEKSMVNVITGVTTSSTSEESKSSTVAASSSPKALNGVHVEMLFMAINTLCDVGLFRPEEEDLITQSPATPVKSTVVDPGIVEGAEESKESARPEESAGDENTVDGPEGVDAEVSQRETADTITAAPSEDAAVDWEKEALVHRVHDYLKSIKVEVRTAIVNAKSISDSSVAKIKDAFQQLIGCFREEKTKVKILDFTALSKEDQEKFQASLRAVLDDIRNVLRTSGISASSSGQHNLSSPNVLKYFPVSLMTQIVSSHGIVGGDVQEEMQLRENFNVHIEKYWDIIIQGSSELLSVPGGDISAFSAVASWKVRLAEVKKTIESQAINPAVTTAVAPTPSQSQSQSQPQPSAAAPPAASGAPALGPAAPASIAAVMPGTLVSKEAYNKLKRELEVKKDELKVALRKVEELSGNIKDTSLESAKKVATRIKKIFISSRANKPAADPNAPDEMTTVSAVELRALRKEVTDLEFVLNATEEKMEALTRESKVMKQILQQPQAYQMSNMNMISPMVTPERSIRRFGHIPQELVDGNIPSPAAILQHLMITSHRHLMDQVIFWRKLTLKRLFATLSELPRTVNHEQEESKQAAEGAQVAAYTSIAAIKSSHGMVSTLSKLNMKSPKIEVVDKSFKNENLDNKTLYRDLRRMRAECVRVATIVDDGKDLERLNAKIAQRPPLSLRDTIAPLHERKQATSSNGEDGVYKARRCKSHTSVLMFRIVNESQSGSGYGIGH